MTGQAVDDRPAIGRVLDDPGPAAQQPRMRRLGEELGEATGDVAQERRRRALRRRRRLGVEPFVRSTAIDEVAR